MKFAFDLAYVYIDLGDPWWRTAVTEMLRSAERVFQHARFVQLSDETTPIHPWAHKILRANAKCKLAEFPDMKAFLLQEHLSKTDLPTVYSGADVIWCGYQAPDIPPSAEMHEVLGLKRVHFRGPAMRQPMIRFARAIDGGKQFDELAPTDPELVGPPPQTTAPTLMDISHIPTGVEDPAFGQIAIMPGGAA